jgi:hypothetical protein
LHTLELVVREFMGNESVQPWMIKIKGLCRHLKMSLSGWTCFAELCAMRHVKILKPPIGGETSGEGITSRCCGTPCERLQFPNIIRKDRRLQFGSWTLSIHS